MRQRNFALTAGQEWTVKAMSDYIKREDAEKLLRYNFLGALTEDERVNELNKVPSADVVEVIRCKDCKFYDTDNDTGFPLCRRLGDIVMKPTDYCSYGK